MRFIIMGHGQHGKGTFCKIAQQHFNLSAISSSEFACKHFVFEHLRAQMGYPDMETCYADRHNHRALWYQLIADFNTPDGTRLGRLLFEQHAIYDGIRSLAEFEALRSAQLFDLAIWVDASARVPAEDASSITVHRGCADIVIENNDTPELYQQRVCRLLRLLTAGPSTH